MYFANRFNSNELNVFENKTYIANNTENAIGLKVPLYKDEINDVKNKNKIPTHQNFSTDLYSLMFESKSTIKKIVKIAITLNPNMPIKGLSDRIIKVRKIILKLDLLIIIT